MPVDPMDDIELRSVQLQFSNGRGGSLSGSCDLRRVVTDKGEVLVAVQGDTSKPAILTYHDLGLNCKCFAQIAQIFMSEAAHRNNLIIIFSMNLQMQRVLLVSSTIRRCVRCLKTSASITLLHRVKRKGHQHYPKSVSAKFSASD